MSSVESASPARHLLLRPRWLLAHLVVITLVTVFVLLGLWQLGRHADRRQRNDIGAARTAMAPVALADLLAGAGGDLEAVRFRMAVVAGHYDESNEVLVRSQVHLGTAGFHVVTPLRRNDGSAVLVNRGWVPITMDTPPVEAAKPPAMEVTVTGWVELTQERPPFGPVDPPDGRLLRVNRVDIARIGKQLPYDLAGVYLMAVGEEEGLPEEVDVPAFDDPGPHLSYAVQWFGFAVVGIVGYVALVRKRIRHSTGSARSSTTS